VPLATRLWNPLIAPHATVMKRIGQIAPFSARSPAAMSSVGAWIAVWWNTPPITSESSSNTMPP
jgi:hypothetical protein